jgi:hypothetical protein
VEVALIWKSLCTVEIGSVVAGADVFTVAMGEGDGFDAGANARWRGSLVDVVLVATEELLDRGVLY